MPAGPEAPDDIVVTVVVPTRNEAPNVAGLVGRLDSTLSAALGPSQGWEVLFVDDSDDSTPVALAALAGAGRHVLTHHRLRGRRPGGLGGAVQEGFAMARGRVIAVMDGDLQHPPEVLPAILAPILEGRADLVSGNRYGGDGDRGGLSGPWRRAVASTSRGVVHAVLPGSRALLDPMSGLFAFERRGIDGVDLQAHGFKILLEVVARGDWEAIDNVGYRFERRRAGRSKASVREGARFAQHLVRLARTTRSGRTTRPALAGRI